MATHPLPPTMSALISDVTPNRSHVHFKLITTTPTPQITTPTDIIIRMDAAPMNPSDIGVIFGASTRNNATQESSTCISSPIPNHLKHTFEKDQYGNSRDGGILCGNEGAGVVVAAGSSIEAQQLLGKVVAVFGSGGCYAQYRKASARGRSINVMHPGTTPMQAASAYVNPLTALGMLSTAKMEGHGAVIHTAAASQLGQMMVKICAADHFPLINIVRRQAQVELLHSIDANAVVLNQSLPNFELELVKAVKSIGATIAFDATGGGALSSQLLNAIDAAGLVQPGKQLYNYGALDTSPSTMTKDQKNRTSFWLLPLWGSKNKNEFKLNMKRVRDEIHTIFATHYTAKVPLLQAVDLNALKVFGQQKTGSKYLLVPNAGGGFSKL